MFIYTHILSYCLPGFMLDWHLSRMWKHLHDHFILLRGDVWVQKTNFNMSDHVFVCKGYRFCLSRFFYWILEIFAIFRNKIMSLFRIQWGRDRMVVGYTITDAISAYHH